MELWKDIKGYEGAYQVSNLGNVKSIDRFVTNSMNVKRKIPGKKMKPTKDKDGYLKVCLCKSGYKKNFTVHRLVATNFLEKEDYSLVINHINEIKTDNRVENLEFCTSKYNANYGKRNSNISKTRKKKTVMGTNIKTGEKIYFESINETKKSGFCPKAVSRCCYKERLKKHKGYTWDFSELVSEGGGGHL